MYVLRIPYSCQILMYLEFSLKIFEKSSNIKLQEKILPMEAELLLSHGLTHRRTDRQN
jgi:hypothetical protein